MKKYLPNEKNIVMSRDEVRAFDSWAINEVGLPGVVLMENAGRSCAELIKEKLTGIESQMVCIFCGTGNNGGDGYVIARRLLKSGCTVTVVICGDRNKIKGDAKINLDVLEKLSGPVEQLEMEDADIPGRVEAFIGGADMVVDGIFGTGLKGQLKDGYKILIKSINALNYPVLAVDIPSGLDCDTGLPMPVCIEAEATVTFVAVKKGFVDCAEAAQATGDVYVASIGIEPGREHP